MATAFYRLGETNFTCQHDRFKFIHLRLFVQQNTRPDTFAPTQARNHTRAPFQAAQSASVGLMSSHGIAGFTTTPERVRSQRERVILLLQGRL